MVTEMEKKGWIGSEIFLRIDSMGKATERKEGRIEILFRVFNL